MADYNIYIHSYGQYDSPTTPVQLRADSDTSGVGGEGGAGGSGFGAVRRAASFIQDPDSAIGAVLSTASGVLKSTNLAPVIFAVGALMKIADKTISFYNELTVSNSGDHAFQIQYNNFKQQIHNAFHPYTTGVNRTIALNELRRENVRNEQERLLTGGTIYNSRYGRYL